MATLTNVAVVVGTKERLRLAPPFLNPGSLEVVTLGEPSATPQGPGRVNRLIEKLLYDSLLQGSFLATLLKGRGRLIPRPRGANGL